MVGVIPELRTERLVLRGFRAADFARFAEMWATPAVVRYLGMAPRGVGESWKAFLAIAGNWALLDMGQWAIAEQATGRVIGQTGFFSGHRQLGADFDAAPECGWVLAPEAWGKGYASEAVGAAHGWFDVQGFGGRSHAMIAAGHRASEAVARRVGYRLFRTADDGSGPLGLFARERDGRPG